MKFAIKTVVAERLDLSICLDDKTGLYTIQKGKRDPKTMYREGCGYTFTLETSHATRKHLVLLPMQDAVNLINEIYDYGERDKT